MQFSSWAVCSWLLATLSPQVFSVQTQVVITGSGDVIKAAKNVGDVIKAARRRGVHLDFGGSKHGLDKHGEKMRPEAVKTQVCEDEPSSKCTECTTQASCWRGFNTGRLKLDVSASASANIYAAEMWASCGGGNGKWNVKVFKNGLVNGVLKIFVDGSLQRTVSSSRESVKTKVSIAKTKHTHVRVLFVRSTAGQKASGFISLYATGVDEYVDDCMGVKNCLVSLGDGTDSAFLFRNSNEQQFACLDASSTDKQNAVSDHCNPWATCLSSSGMKSKLKALLGAALNSRGSLAEGEIKIQKLNDAEGCVDPSVEDPESWECECVDEMTASCGGVDEECFNEILCKNTNVCESWKGAHCADLLLAKQNISIKAFQIKSAALTRRAAQRAIAIVDDRLDSALSGKCSQ